MTPAATPAMPDLGTFATYAPFLGFVLFVGMIVCAEVGHLVARRRAREQGRVDGAGLIDTAIFALLGLLVAFTFSGAAERFDKRRSLIVEEANAIGTAYLRLDMLPAPTRDDMRLLFRRYVEARLAIYRALPDTSAARAHFDAADGLQQEIWERAVAVSAGAQDLRMLLLPAVNDMIDITTTRTMAMLTHTPPVIFILLIGFALVSALLAGRALPVDARRHWLRSVLYALTMSAAIYVIIDMEYPRAGVIRIDDFDSVLESVRSSMKP